MSTVYKCYLNELNYGDITHVEFPIAVGTATIQTSWDWFDNDAYELYSQWLRIVANFKDVEPLYNITTGEIVRDYDYLEYYTTIEDADEWLENTDLIPYVIRNANAERQSEWLTEKIAICRDIAKRIQIYDDSLYWYCTCTLEGEEQTFTVKPGSILTFSNGLSITIGSYRERIGQYDLSTITLTIEVSNV